MDPRSDRHPEIARAKGMRVQREVEMGTSGSGKPIWASGNVAAQTGRTQTRNRQSGSDLKALLTRGGRPHKPFPQPQHGLEPPDRSSRRVEGLEAADPRHRPLDPEMIAFDPLLQVLGDVMQRVSW